MGGCETRCAPSPGTSPCTGSRQKTQGPDKGEYPLDPKSFNL